MQVTDEMVRVAGYAVLVFMFGALFGASLAFRGMHRWVASELRKARALWHESNDLLNQAMQALEPPAPSQLSKRDDAEDHSTHEA